MLEIKLDTSEYLKAYNLYDEASMEIAASIQKTVDKTTVNLQQSFTYTINASFSGLTGSITNAQITDFIPNFLNYTLPPINPPLQNIIQTPVAGGTLLTFDFGTITDTGISIVITLSASFKTGTPSGTSFTNSIDQYANGSLENTTTAPPVTLLLNGDWGITKSIASPIGGQVSPGSSVTYQVVLANTGDYGATATNIVITDTLPAGLVPDLSFTPTGIDVSNIDPNVLNLTGTWSGNTMTFIVPSYFGTNYKILYKAILDPNASIGQTVTNTANLTIDGSSKPSTSSTLTVANSIISVNMSKYGAEHASPGSYVTYPIYFLNTGNQDITNAVLIDTIPNELIVKQVVPGRVCSPSDCPVMNITISYEINNSGTFTVLGSYPNVAYQRIDLPDPGVGNKITAVKWLFPVVPAGGGSAVAEGERVTGIVDPNTTSPSFTNVVTLTGDNLPTPFTASITTILDGKNSPSLQKQNDPTTNVVPGQTIKYTLSAFCYWGPYTDPIFADLLPPEVDYDNNVLYRLYYSPTNQTIYSTDPNFPTFLNYLTPEVIPNYQGTGRTLVRFKFAPGSVITQESYLQIDFNVKVKVGATGTIINEGVFGSATDNMIVTHGQLSTTNSQDLIGTGNTSATLLLSPQVQNGINFSTSLASDKKVKGSLDTIYTEWPNVGMTTAGGLIDYKLTVTNTGNVDLQSFELIDILPHIGDTGVILNTIPRNSQFTVYQITAVNAVLSPMFPGDPTPVMNIDYSTSYDPIRFSQTDLTSNTIGTGTWQSTLPVPITSTAAFKLTSINTKLKPGQSIIIDITCVAPIGAPTGLVAWNSFGLRGSYLDQNGNLAYLLPVEPQQVGIELQPQAPTLAALGDYVWYDTNGNGIQDPGEPGINGLTVNLYDSTGTTLISSTLTAPDFNSNDGFYQFGNLTPGCYIVEFIKPGSNFVFSPKGQGSDASKDSNVNPSTGRTDQVCLVAGQYDPTIDAGLSQNVKAFLGDFVWNDLNKNGIQDPGEPGIPNVTVNLLDAGGNVIGTTTTDSSGNYFFSVDPGCYFVEFIKPTGYNFTLQNAGSDDTKDSDADPATGITPQVCLNAGDVNPTVDAGLYVPAKVSLGDYVWEDLNKNGIQDIGEPGIPGVTVQLLDSNGVQIASTTTDPNGFYSFNVDAGCYTVKFIKPLGYNFTIQNAGSDVGLNSNPDPITGISPQVCLTEGQSDLTIDAGLYKMASIGDFVWNDLNHNGIQDPGEPGVSGVVVNLLDSNGIQIATTTTDSNGIYGFNVDPGCYTVEFIKPTGYVFTLQNAGSDDTKDSDADPITGITPQVCVVSGESNLTIDAGIYIPAKASIGDFVWNDLNANGIQDPGEPGVSGVVVNLLDSNGIQIATTTTDSNGFYNFDVDAGCYTVSFVKPNGSTFTIQNAGSDDTKDSDADPVTGNAPQVCVLAGEVNHTIDAGLVYPASIGDFVWNDLNHNGIQDPGEPGVSGVVVNLLDSNGIQIATTITDSNGIYGFNVNPGCYTVEFIKPTGYVFTLQNAGSDDTKDSDADPITGITPQVCVVSGESNLTIDAGIYIPAKASIGDFVWNDLNANGIQDPDEPGVSGVVVNLLDSNGIQIATTTTDSNGFYNFDVDAGCYTVSFVKPNGSTFTIQNAGSDDTKDSDADPVTGNAPQVCVLAGEVNHTIDAGLVYPASIGDFVWNDLNHNGIQDPGEPGVSGLVVNLLDSNGIQIATTITDSNGIYGFNVNPGCYTVEFIKPTGYVFTLQNAGSDDTKDSDADPITGITPQVCVVSGESNLTIDAGIYIPAKASIGDFVWNDLNANGIQDPGEPGVSGVVVNLLDSNGIQIATTTTDSNGFYNFDVDAACYTVSFVKPNGSTFTIQNAGSDDTKDSDADPVTGNAPQVCVLAGEVNHTIDAGLVYPASIGDFVWNDLNANGIQDPGEPGVSGVVVNLLDSNGIQIATTTTDSNGIYGFNVNPGCYTVEFIKPTGYVFTLQNAGSDDTKDSDANPITGITPQVCVVSGESNLTIDAGLYQPALLGDYVWEDLNMNGIQDSGEPSLYNVTVNLLDNTGKIIATTKTDNNGKYLFAVAPGCYSIQVIRPTSYMFTTQNVAADPSKISAVNQTTGITTQVCLKSGEQNLNLDAGVYLIPCAFRQSVNDLIESIALEETGLSHIINAEGEKIQAALALKLSTDDLLSVNTSVTETLKIISKLEILLQYKLEITEGICPK